MEDSDEALRLRMRVGVLEESVRSCELDCKAGRETALRLVDELERERKRSASSAAALDSARMELEDLLSTRRSSEMEKETLMERLEASRRVTEAARQESNCLEKQVEELERKLQLSRAETRNAEEKFQMFLDKVAELLRRTSEKVIKPTEREVLQEVDDLCNKRRSASETEARLLRERTELQNSTTRRAELAEQAEQQARDLREGLRRVEAELLTAEEQRDGWRLGRQKHQEFLQQLSAAMKVDAVAVDVGFDMTLDLILSRAEQLVQQETAALVESKSRTLVLQRKLKTQREQLDSKGLHIQLLRKKVSQLEEERRSSLALAVRRDDANVEARRLQRRLERLQSELKAVMVSNRELKDQLSHSGELKMKVMEQQKKQLEQLVEGKSQVEKRLKAVNSDLRSQEQRSREEQQRLLTLRRSLAQLSEREQEVSSQMVQNIRHKYDVIVGQMFGLVEPRPLTFTELVDFRTVVSQMLGLHATCLTHPNHDIIKVLETLLHHHHHHHLHHVSGPWYCPTHLHTQDPPDSSSVDLHTCRSAPRQED